MNDNWLALGIVIVFPFVFCGMWIFVSMLLSVIGGWKTLAASYPDSSRNRDYSHTFQGGKMGLANYNGILMIGGDESGLHLAVMILFRPFHPPISIPWEDVHNLEFTQFLFTKRVRFTTSAHPRIRVQLPEKVMKEIRRNG